MKTIKFLLPAIIFMIASVSAFSQKYKTADDTVKLNKEYLDVSNDVANLTSKLEAAKKDLESYNDKAGDAVSDAQNAAAKNSDQALKSTGDDVSDARKAKRRAKKAFKEAKDARHATGRAEDQNKKIENLSSDLEKKQKRLQELDEMRTSIKSAQQ